MISSPQLTFSKSECAGDCTPGACQLRCSLEIVDELLSTPGAVSGDDTDILLDFRQAIRSRQDAELALRLFCDLRRRLEQRHYLAFYRLRRWLENHLVAHVRACPAADAVATRPNLNAYCVEAVRRSCLCAALNQGVPLLAPRLSFGFVPKPVHTSKSAAKQFAAIA